MNVFYSVSGSILGPFFVMGFIGYHLGEYLDRKALTIAVCLLIGFVVSCVDVWKLLSRKDAHK